MGASNTMVSHGCISNAALTPTPIDDGLVKKAYKVLDWVAGSM